MLSFLFVVESVKSLGKQNLVSIACTGLKPGSLDTTRMPDAVFYQLMPHYHSTRYNPSIMTPKKSRRAAAKAEYDKLDVESANLLINVVTCSKNPDKVVRDWGAGRCPALQGRWASRQINPLWDIG